MSKISADESIDVRDKTITTFIVFNAVMKLRDMSEEEVLEVVTDNFEPIESDIRAWCRMTGHKLLELEEGESYQRYYIEKGLPQEKGKKLAVVISNAGLLELLSPLGFALGAALEDIDVYIYFQGPAVRVMKRGFKGNLHGLSRPFSGFARRGLAKVGHIPPQDKIRQLKELGAHFYMCGPSMERFGAKKSELIFDDVIVAEYLTFMEVMNEADIHIFLQ
ncbi:DsrE family protein [Candidatus Poribacteria bacterium]